MQTYITNSTGDSAPTEQSLIKEVVETQSVSYEDSGVNFLVATDALVVTLPATKKGVKYTFINSGADGNNTITLSPNENDAIIGSIANASADSVASGTDDKNIVNTKATANKGDRITLIGDGVAGWYILEGVGIWASQA